MLRVTTAIDEMGKQRVKREKCWISNNKQTWQNLVKIRNMLTGTTKQQKSQCASHHQWCNVCIILWAQFIIKTTYWLINGLFIAGPIDTPRCIYDFVFLWIVTTIGDDGVEKITRMRPNNFLKVKDERVMKKNSLTGKFSPCWKYATGTMCKSHEKLSRVILYGFSASTEKLPSESPLLSILIVDPVTPAKWLFFLFYDHKYM